MEETVKTAENNIRKIITKMVYINVIFFSVVYFFINILTPTLSPKFLFFFKNFYYLHIFLKWVA